MHAEKLLRIRIKNQFQAAGGVAANLAARNCPEKRDTHFVGHPFLGELLFRFANERNFWNGVNPVRIVSAIRTNRNAKGIGGSDATLLHGNGTKAREADDIADRENVWLLGAVIIVDRNAAPRIGFEAGVREIQFVDIALSA